MAAGGRESAPSRVSGDAAVCVHQRPIAGHTNENGSMPALLDELKSAATIPRLSGAPFKPLPQRR